MDLGNESWRKKKTVPTYVEVGHSSVHSIMFGADADRIANKIKTAADLEQYIKKYFNASYACIVKTGDQFYGTVFGPENVPHQLFGERFASWLEVEFNLEVKRYLRTSFNVADQDRVEVDNFCSTTADIRWDATRGAY